MATAPTASPVPEGMVPASVDIDPDVGLVVTFSPT